MSATLFGTSGPVEQNVSYRFSPFSGVTTSVSHKGTLEKLAPVVSQLRNEGWSGELTQGPGGIWTVSASIGGDEGGELGGQETTESWELLPNTESKDLLSSDNTLINSLTSKDINDITKQLETHQDDQTDPTFTNNATNCLKVYNLLKAGVKTVQVFQPTLRHTFIVPRNMPSSLVFSNVGKCLTNAQMKTYEGMPNDFLIPVSTFPSTAPTRSSISMNYGWFKIMPTLNLSAWGRREIHIEYKWGLWATDIFTFAT